MLSFADALQHARYAREEAEKAYSNKAGSMLLHLKKARQEFACAMLQVAAYRESVNEGAKLSALGTIKVFNELYSVQGAVENEIKEALDGKTQKLGSQAERIAEFALASDSAWKSLVIAAIASTYAILDEKHEGTLTLSSKDRSLIVGQLEKTVGKKYRKDNRALEVTVTQLVAFINNKKWKSARQ